MNKVVDAKNIDGKYVPPADVRERMQKWIVGSQWYKRRHGHQREILLLIAKDCGYTALPKLPASIKALIGGHIGEFFSKQLAWRFNKMVDELG